MSVRVRDQPLVRECLAEFLGTFILMAFGTGVGAQVLLSHREMGNTVSSCVAWGVGVTMGIYVAGGVSGGHLNPAVSVALAAVGRLSWHKVPVYYLSQCLGSFAACGFVYLVYWEALGAIDGGFRRVEGTNATGGIWFTYPQPYVSVWTCLGDQTFSTSLLLICVMAMSDSRDTRPSGGTLPASIGLCVTALGLAFSLNCGAAMNPARDLMPRIFILLAGWDLAPFSYRDYNFFWVTIVGPHVGAVLGAYIYQTFIGYHWPVATSDVASSMTEEVDMNPAKRPAPDKGVTLNMYRISPSWTDAFRQSKGFRQDGLNEAFEMPQGEHM